MGLKELFGKFSAGNVEKKRKFKELEEDFIMQKKLEERQKSANERELERFISEDREEKIKERLNQFRKKRTHDSWTGSKILHEDFRILDNGNPILKQKNVMGLIGGTKKKQETMGFLGGTKAKQRGGMFFK